MASEFVDEGEDAMLDKIIEALEGLIPPVDLAESLKKLSLTWRAIQSRFTSAS